MGIAVGIDFGTTNTVVSYVRPDGSIKQIKHEGKKLTPSMLYFKSHDECVIGRQARKKAHENQGGADVSSFKTKLGNDDFSYAVEAENGEAFYLKPKTALKYFLNQLLGDAPDRLLEKYGEELDRAVVTVPAKFNDKQIRMIRMAVMEALSLERNRVKIVFEPTAASRAADSKPEETVLIYDFGGGTFDVSVIKQVQGVYREIATGGLPGLGGDNLTEKLTQELIERINEKYETEFTRDEDVLADYDEVFFKMTLSKYRHNIHAIRDVAEETKEELSRFPEHTPVINLWLTEDESVQFETTVTRGEFERLIKKDIDRTVEITRKAIEEAGGVDRVVLAGGSSSIPLIRKRLQESLENSVKISDESETGTLISRGAAEWARDFTQIEQQTEGRTKFDIGVVAKESVVFGRFQPIISAGQKFPAEGTHEFTIYRDGLEHLEIDYYERDSQNYPESDREGDEGITLIDTLELELPQGLKKDDAIVTVTFRAEKDGSLEMSAKVRGMNGRELAKENLTIKARESDLM